MLELHLGKTQCSNPFARLVLQQTNPLYRIHLTTKSGQHGSLITTAGTNLEDFLARSLLHQQLGHARHHPGLGNGLSLTNRQCGVVVAWWAKALAIKKLRRGESITANTPTTVMPGSPQRLDNRSAV